MSVPKNQNTKMETVIILLHVIIAVSGVIDRYQTIKKASVGSEELTSRKEV
jgi:hypothetical protein